MLSNEQIKTRFVEARKAQVAGKLDDAADGYRKLIKQAPKLAEAYYNLAEILTLQKNSQQAATNFEAALKLRPKEPAIWLSYLQMAERHPNVDNLEALVKRSKAVIGHMPAHGFFAGLLAARQDDFAKAVPLYKAAISKGFNSPRARVEYASALNKLEQNDAALVQLDKALETQPNNGLALARKSELLREMGQFDEAMDAAKAALKRNPESGTLYHTYCTIKKVAADDPCIPKMIDLIKSPQTQDDAKVFLGHGLAKAMEDTKQNDKVFGYLKIANDANARANPYDYDTDKNRVKYMQNAYLKLREIQPTPLKKTDSAPIFVTGLPRSGTTLVEQIISSAQNVEGGGEMGILVDMLSDAWTTEATNDPSFEKFNRNLIQVGHDFAAETKRRFPKAEHVTDKSISTYSQLGFVKMAMPNAKIVVVRRDPRDNAMSIYKNLFAFGTHRYAAKLENIAKFMRLFEQQVEFWRTHCPENFFEIRYEDLISDQEAQTRKLVDAVELEWDDRFLESHKNKRKVKTLSVVQVRQPIYSSSVGAWRNYAVELAPFMNAYGAE